MMSEAEGAGVKQAKKKAAPAGRTVSAQLARQNREKVEDETHAIEDYQRLMRDKMEHLEQLSPRIARDDPREQNLVRTANPSVAVCDAVARYYQECERLDVPPEDCGDGEGFSSGLSQQMREQLR